MDRSERFHGCAPCGMSRRRFIATGCAACAAAAGVFPRARALRAAPEGGKVRIRVVYSLHAEKQPRPDWPNVGFDFRPVMERINAALRESCPGFECIPTLATGPDQAKKIVEEDKSRSIDGYLVYQMNCWNRVVETVATTGKPVLYADFQYGGSGGFLVYTAGFLRSTAPNVGFVASSKIEDLTEAVKCFRIVKEGRPVSEFVAATARVRRQRTPKPGDLRSKPDAVALLSPDACVARMKESKILAVRGTQSGPAAPIMGIPVLFVPFAELNEAWKRADKEEASAMADGWTKAARRIAGVNREALTASAAMGLGMRALLEKHGANAITINCLGGFYGGHLQAYPCMGHHELLNSGLIGACECDLRSTATMVAMTALTKGRPGYISDPVIDTSKRQIIYAHCVASNRAFGPDGPANPFEILTHSEDRKGASVRSLLPVGCMTTTVEFAHERKEILLHRGKTVENDPEDRACRTKLAAEPVGDIEKLFTEWDRWGWHRVTYYGDLKEPVLALADTMGFKVTEEA